jgi:hypothetical protein
MTPVLCTILLLLSSLLSLVTCSLPADFEICPEDTEERVVAALNLAKENCTLSEHLLSFYTDLEPKLLSIVSALVHKEKVSKQVAEFKKTVLKHKIFAANLKGELSLLQTTYNGFLDHLMEDDQDNHSHNTIGHIDWHSEYFNPPGTNPKSSTISTLGICSKINSCIKNIEKVEEDLQKLADIHYFPLLACYTFHDEDDCIVGLCVSMLWDKIFEAESI